MVVEQNHEWFATVDAGRVISLATNSTNFCLIRYVSMTSLTIVLKKDSLTILNGNQATYGYS